MQNARYDGKPLLRLLELLVLSIIGQLDDSTRKQLDSLAPKLRSTYKRTGSWEEVLSAELRIDDRTRLTVQEQWAREEGRGMAAQDFAARMSDELIGS